MGSNSCGGRVDAQSHEFMPLSALPFPSLARHLALETGDLDRARGHIGGVFAPHRLEFAAASPSRTLAFQHARVAFGSLSLNLLRYGGDVVVGAPALEDFYLLQLTLSGSCVIEARGGCHIALGPGTLFMVDPTHNYRKRWSVDGAQLIVRIERKAVEQAIAEEIGRPLAPRFTDRALVTSEAPTRSLLRFLEAVLRDLGEETAQCAKPAVQRHIERGLIGLLLEAVPHSLGDELGRRETALSVAAPGIVRRAEAFIRERAAEPIGLEDVARAAGAGPRTLQAGFRRFRETTPMAYLKTVRLDKARRDLAEGRCASVTDAAFKNGFGHLGKFARDYRARFGEAPSTTLRHNRG
jgi:AraC-like DNA-binding protein